MIFCFDNTNYSTNTSMIDEKIQKDSSIIVNSAVDNRIANEQIDISSNSINHNSIFQENGMNIEETYITQSTFNNKLHNYFTGESNEPFIQNDMILSLYAQENNFFLNRDYEFGQDYMLFQSDITGSMRKVLVEYLMQVVENWNYSYSTFFTAIYILDRYLSKNQVSRDQLQLIGISSLLISAKFHDVKPFSVSAYEYVCDGACSQKEILEFELLILKNIDYMINPPTLFTFFEVICRINQTDESIIKYGIALLHKICLKNSLLCSYYPSFLAQVVYLMSMLNFGKVSESYLNTFCLSEREKIIKCIRLISK